MAHPKTLVDFVSDPAFLLDKRLQLIGWNKGAQSLMGYSFSEIKQRPRL